MYSISKAFFPELVLLIVASALFLMGTSKKRGVRGVVPLLALLAMGIALVSELSRYFNVLPAADPWQSAQITEFARYIKIISAAIGILLVLLSWPNNADHTAGPAVHFGDEIGEFFGLLLLSIMGLFLVAGANDMMLLFLGIELSSLPTYIMVSISRPQPVAQEAGVKYFFLGAMASAVMLMGFSYLYGTTGTVYLQGGAASDGTILAGVDTVIRAASVVTPWQMLAAVLLITGFAFKMVAVPMHMYAPDVYQGAATPVTALLSFVPKTAGFVALLKVLYAVGGGSWALPPQIGELIWWLAILTMTFGNVLGLLQQNIKRVLAYSSIAHSGYMLVAVAALVTVVPGAVAGQTDYQALALRGVLFYLFAYGLTNIAAFGVLSLLPARVEQVGSSAETFDEIAGVGRRHVGLGLAMSVACFSLIGIPLTIGFVGKVLLIQPALHAGLGTLVVALVANSAVSAAYYLRIVAALFLRPADESGSKIPPRCAWSLPIRLAIFCSVVGMLLLGAYVPAVNRMVDRAQAATQIQLPGAVSVAGASGVVTARASGDLRMP